MKEQNDRSKFKYEVAQAFSGTILKANQPAAGETLPASSTTP
jgi:hypothetical protein